MVARTAHEASIRSHFRSVNSFTNRDALRTAAYADASKLADRQAIYRFIERPWPSDGGRVIGALGERWRGDETVVDVGCGNGHDQRDLRAAGHAGPILAIDLSPGMLQTLEPDVIKAVADAVALPLGDDVADLALAMHMLYHCPDIPATVAELRRVVRPGGALVVSTNSVDHLQELRELWTAALSEVLGQPVRPWQTSVTRFSLEDAPEALARSFDHVVVHRTENRLLVPEVGAALDYVQSTRDLSGADVADDEWDRAVALLGERVRDVVAADGALGITVANGVLVAH